MIDPIRLELIKNALVMVSDNMMVSVLRTSRSTLVKANMDFSASICDGDGNMVAQGLALPAHLGATMPALKGCIDYFGSDIVPGDILANNDPYAGGSHLNDIFMFKPVFKDGVRVCFLGLILHHTDLGGRVAGGQAADSNEIYEEGLRIPPSKIYQGGQPNDTLLRIIEHNTRVPDKVLGDVRAQIAALDAGETEIHKLVETYGAAEVKTYMTALIDYTERLVRNSIAALPDGETEFTEWNDDDGVGGGPVRIHIKLTVKGDEIIADYTGTSPQMGGALHTNYWFTASLTYAGLRAVMPPDTPNNVGFYRPITVIAPEGSWVNPRFPAAVGARGQGGYRVRTVVTGALAKLLPDRMPACPGGNEFGLSVTGLTPDRKRFLHVEFHNMTGRGGGPDQDGQDAGPYWLGNLSNTPVEVIEAENPLRIEEYGFLTDTGGPGKYRGALGMVRQYRLLNDDAIVQQRADRHVFPCWGIFGGKPGALSHSYFIRDGEREEAPSKFVRSMRKDEIFRAEMAGSGGYGDPLERDPEAVADDVRQDKMTPDHAKAEYGVILEPETLALDTGQTTALRKRRAAEPSA
ncbi:MAG: hydantoinase B/oxoprolinase family protein [Alphaproteobacteria bacterium]|nr:hydantoinase B/oxoprolinase family protein [Alphaproteobacteria bacterium]